MKRFFRILSIALLCGALSAPVVSAQRHGGNNGGREHTTQSSKRGNNASRTQGNRHNNSSQPNKNNGNGVTGRPGVGNKRPNTNKDHGTINGSHNNSNRPNIGNGNHNNGNRPNIGNGNHNNGNRPNIGNGNHNNHRPNVGNGNHGSTGRPGLGNRPGNGNHNNGNHNWGNNHRPHRPGVGHAPAHRPSHLALPPRPYRPNMYRPHYRPTPPPRWRPARGIPAIRGILGITFGTGISLSLDYLYNSGFVVDGYSNDVVYLRNVNQLNYIWTDAALYYGSNGLDASSFYYATPVYDLTRYNAVYNNLVALYGQPVAINSAGQLGATWFGGNNGYITLSFGANNVAGGALRYLTTLTFGL